MPYASTAVVPAAYDGSAGEWGKPASAIRSEYRCFINSTAVKNMLKALRAHGVSKSPKLLDSRLVNFGQDSNHRIKKFKAFNERYDYPDETNSYFWVAPIADFHVCHLNKRFTGRSRWPWSLPRMRFDSHPSYKLPNRFQARDPTANS